MTLEEKMNLRHKMHLGSKMLVERIEKIAQTTDAFSWTELMYMADIIKDLAESEMYLAKACHYEKESPERKL